VSVAAYWFSNLIVDVGKHIIPAVFCALMILAFNVSSMLEDNNYGAMWLFFFLYGWAIIPFCYAFSFLFRQQGTPILSTNRQRNAAKLLPAFGDGCYCERRVLDPAAD
jgi:ATP-binding cassette subfamily A (ABC1) protein 3